MNVRARSKPLFTTWMFSCLFLVAFTSLHAQVDGDGHDPDAAPPPPKIMSKAERSQLEAEHDVKDRTKLALAFMSARLARAEELNVKGEFPGVYSELGGFHALMDDTLEFLFNNPRERNNVLANFKRFEITLRTFAPRLSLIRRELPLEYDHYVRSLLKYLRDARSKAVEPMFSDSVVPSRRNGL